MSERKLKDSIGNLEKAVNLLEAALKEPRNRPLVFEGTIHRFEMTIELMWKTLRRALQFEGESSVRTSRDALKTAFRLGWLEGDDEGTWIDMIEKRNTTSHEYLAEVLAEDNYNDIAKVTPLLRKAFDFLKKRYA